MTSSTHGVRIAIACLTVAAFGCVSGREGSDEVRIPTHELLAGRGVGIVTNATHTIDARELLAVTPDMESFLAAHIGRQATAELKLRQLVHAIIGSGAFVIEYDASTRTASDTFRMRRGNCLSFSSMFVAMARHVGLDAVFQEVEIPPDWTLHGGTFVLNQHVNVHVDLGSAGKKVVDFNIADFRASYPMRTISDARALAHFYNNLAVEHMQRGDLGASIDHLRNSVASSDGRYAPAWTNLGTLYSRCGAHAHAEAAYLEALRADSSDPVAMSNLARLYQTKGDAERAAAYRRKVIRHRNQNPYYRYVLARNAYAMRQYDDAIRHLRHAIRSRQKDDRFYFLLGLAYLRKGDDQAARRWMAAATAIAGDESRSGYSEKIERLKVEHVLRRQ